jgi:hypothetical protein
MEKRARFWQALFLFIGWKRAQRVALRCFSIGWKRALHAAFLCFSIGWKRAQCVARRCFSIGWKEHRIVHGCGFPLDGKEHDVLPGGAFPSDGKEFSVLPDGDFHPMEKSNACCLAVFSIGWKRAPCVAWRCFPSSETKQHVLPCCSFPSDGKEHSMLTGGAFPRRPSPVARRPSPVAHRPSPVACRPSPVARRPSPSTPAHPAPHRAEPRNKDKCLNYTFVLPQESPVAEPKVIEISRCDFIPEFLRWLCEIGFRRKEVLRGHRRSLALAMSDALRLIQSASE